MASIYRITNTASGTDLGVWAGETEAAALDAFCREAGYRDASAAAAALGGPLDGAILVECVDRRRLMVDGVDGDTFGTDVQTFADANNYDPSVLQTIGEALRDGQAVGGGGAAPEYTVHEAE